MLANYHYVLHNRGELYRCRKIILYIRIKLVHLPMMIAVARDSYLEMKTIYPFFCKALWQPTIDKSKEAVISSLYLKQGNQCFLLQLTLYREGTHLA